MVRQLAPLELRQEFFGRVDVGIHVLDFVVGLLQVLRTRYQRLDRRE